MYELVLVIKIDEGLYVYVLFMKGPLADIHDSAESELYF